MTYRCQDHEYACDACLSEGLTATLQSIADTLNDYMDLTLAGQAATAAMQARNPDIEPILRPLTDAMRKVADRRLAR